MNSNPRLWVWALETAGFEVSALGHESILHGTPKTRRERERETGREGEREREMLTNKPLQQNLHEILVRDNSYSTVLATSQWLIRKLCVMLFVFAAYMLCIQRPSLHTGELVNPQRYLNPKSPHLCPTLQLKPRSFINLFINPLNSKPCSAKSLILHPHATRKPIHQPS